MDTRVVLIVEDEAPLRELYTNLLEEHGISVITAETGQAGVTLALEQHPDVIVMDVMLPDISGHEAVAQIRRDNWGKTAKIIYLTNRSDAESVTEAVAHKSDEYIIKAHTDNQEFLNKVRSSMVADL